MLIRKERTENVTEKTYDVKTVSSIIRIDKRTWESSWIEFFEKELHILEKSAL
jgi:hypothetical protein